MRNIFSAISIILLLWILISCNKKSYVKEPIVNIYEPVNKQVYVLPDEIHIDFSVEHDKPIEYIRVSIDNSEMTHVSNAYYYYPEGNSYNADFNLPVEILQEKVVAPPYYMHIVVSDFATVSNTYREVELSNGKMKYKGCFVVAKHGVNILKISYLDDLFNIKYNFGISGNYMASGISGTLGRLIIATRLPDYVRAYNSNDGNREWIKVAQLPYPLFNNIRIDKGKVYISTGIGRIIALDNGTGSQLFNTPVLRDTVPGNICLTNDYLISDNTLRNSGLRLWISYYKPTGVKYNMFITNFETVDLYAVGTLNYMIAFCNNGTSGHIITFNVDGNYIYSDFVITDKNINHSCKIDSENYLFTTDKGIFSFSRNSEAIVKVSDIEEGVVDIEYNYINNQVLIVHFNKIDIFSYPSFNKIEDIEMLDSIRDVELLYGH